MRPNHTQNTPASTLIDVSVALDEYGLYPRDHPYDLVLRGFGQDEIRELTGSDVGYHGNGVRAVLTGIDRFDYKVSHVKHRVGDDQVQRAFDVYAAHESMKADLLAAVGLRGENIVKLKVLFEASGHFEAFLIADKARRLKAVRDSTMEKYGVENIFELKEYQDRAAATRIEKYGAAYTLQAESSLSEGARRTAMANLADPESKAATIEKRRDTMMERYGVAVSMLVPGALEKSKATQMERYGVPSYTQSDEFKKEIRERWAARTPEELRVSAEKRRATNIERYGFVRPSQQAQHREAQSRRMRDPEHQLRIRTTRKQSGLFDTSKDEQAIGSMLIEQFGGDDVETQYFSETYPFACDFYIKPRKLFVEINGLWTHGPHWFDVESTQDKGLVDVWREKNTQYYTNAIDQWTRRDVIKRNTARDASLNYVVFWGQGAVDECALWLAMGAPDGRDQDVEYSWLPHREIDFKADLPELKYGVRFAQRAARAVNGREFFKRELQLWAENEKHPKGGTTRSRLFVNRFKYKAKLPHELTDVEILNGLGISGVVRRHTTFDVSGMKQVIDEHRVTSIYDPCAGWGERLFCAASLDVSYFGVDVNEVVVDGHGRMADAYGLTKQTSIVGDAAKVDRRSADHDMVFTCPPYGSTEIYTERGAENLSDDAFIDWWRAVVAMSVSDTTRVFAYQISQKWKARMNEVLVDAGWSLVDQIPIGVDRVSHFNRAAGRQKTEFEEIQVFSRV